jgi:hypothetical protein
LGARRMLSTGLCRPRYMRSTRRRPTT